MELLLLLPLGLLIYWDFRVRSVLLWHLLLFGLIQTGVCIYKYGVTLAGWNALINAAILLFMGVAVAVYFFFRYRKKQNPIGMGDVIFILLLTPYFNHRPFLYFLILSFTLTLIGWVAWNFNRKEKPKNIPLISGVGICYALLLIYNSIVPLW